MFDIDHFKSVNDTYGHHAGDSVLCEIAALISKNVRLNDLFARWGGEEFMILVTNTVSDNARMFAEKLRHAIESHPFPDAGHVTCSFGVAQFQGDETADRFIRRVDAALYRAKARGRNRVEMA
jgi:diguanylate cyclase (GGDEF)-like protein